MPRQLTEEGCSLRDLKAPKLSCCCMPKKSAREAQQIIAEAIVPDFVARHEAMNPLASECRPLDTWASAALTWD